MKMETSGANQGPGSETIVVVGGGMAAHRFCEQLVQRGGTDRYRVVVLSEESRPAYDRVHLTEVLTGRDPESLELGGDAWCAEHEIEWHGKAVVETIDLPRRTVSSSCGHVLRFDRLVFATGSAPILPTIPGSELPGVFTYRTADDAVAIAAAATTSARGGGRAVVVGGGLLGLEVANAIRELGCPVTILERGPRLMPRQLDSGASERLSEAVLARGFGLELAAAVRGLSGSEGDLEIDLEGGWTLAADFVVLAVGVRPRDELAASAGIACHPGGGIIVDEALETSTRGVFAIGECARHDDTLYGLVAPARAMAAALAGQLLGDSTPFGGITPATRLKLPGIEVSIVGESLSARPGDRVLTWGDERRYRCLTVNEGRLRGAISVGGWEAWPAVQEAVARGARIRLAHERRFRDIGEPWRRTDARPIDRWPDAAIVCSCTGVDCGALRAAMTAGARTPTALASATQASTVCGSCEPQLAELCGTPETAEKGADRGLLLAAGLGLAATVAIATSPPIPVVESIQSFGYDELWRSSLARKVTGFTTLGLCIASLTLSLRKRFPALRAGAFASWRRLHAGLGIAALLGVGLHTGLRLGARLDLALMITFLGLSALGAAAGAIAALERRLSLVAGGQLRRLGRAAHVVVFWPFVVLVSFHVLKVFWF